MDDLVIPQTSGAAFEPQSSEGQTPSTVGFIVEKTDARASQRATEVSIDLDESSATHLTMLDENFVNQRRLDSLRQDFAVQLLLLMRDEGFEYGVDTRADAMVRQQMSLNKLATKSWLNTLFVENFANPGVIVGLLRIVARLDYLDVYPEGQTMAVAALSHSSLQVQECGIRAFESWGTLQSLNILENLSVSAAWLRDYVAQVIADLKKEHHVSVG